MSQFRHFEPEGIRKSQRQRRITPINLCVSRAVHARGDEAFVNRAERRDFPIATTTRSAELVEKRLCVFQVGGVEALGKPTIDRCQQVAGFGAATLVAAQPGEAHGGAQFVAPCALLARDRERGAERVLGLRRLGVWQASGELAGKR